MTCRVAVVVCLDAAMGFGMGFGGRPANAQTPEGLPKVADPVAYVYVAYAPEFTEENNGTNEVAAYAANSSGELTRVSGSPFQEDVTGMAVNGGYLMAEARTTPKIEAYRIETNGSIRFAISTEYSGHSGQDCCASAGALYFDHTGADLYVQGSDFIGSNNGVYSFKVDKATGALDFLGRVDTGNFLDPDIESYFIGNNVYSYSANSGDCLFPQAFLFKRNSNGNLSQPNVNPIKNSPTPPAGARVYLPEFGVADTTDHVAFVEIPANPPECSSLPPQIGSYTAASNGVLSTTNTAAEMPKTLITNPFVMQMAPSGLLVAVGGQEGLQVFHFNGAKAPTEYTGLLTTDPIDQMFWDKENHLYAISTTGNRLHVFTITPTSHHEATGSPYSIKHPENIIVQPWPRF